MKKIIFGLTFLITLISIGGCKKYLDINTDEDTPQNPDPTSVFPTQLAGIPRGIQFDARYVGKYIQNWLTGTNNNQNVWDLHGYLSGSDVNGDIWRQTYYGLGKNLEYIIDESEKKERWDVAGAGLALKAFMFQTATDYHGEIGFYDLYKDDQVFYKYTSQDSIYRAVDSLCRKAIDYLSRTPKLTGLPTLSRGDFVYNGDLNKWRKFAYGILAINWGHLTNKPSLYNADSVIKYCDNALSDINGTDDFLIPFSATKTDDANFFGTYRSNLQESTPAVSFKASKFIVKLLDGTTFIGNTAFSSRDPRLRHMLSASQDTLNGNGGYRGIDPGLGDPNSGATTGAAARQRVASLWGDSTYLNPSSSVFTQSAGKYLFRDKAVHPIMTYSEIQFIKAEALFKKLDMGGALTAYRNGVLGHMNFINRDAGIPLGNTPLYNTVKISPQEINFYMNTSGAVKTTAAALTLSDIMLQKYIALWGWGFVETWSDLRRYDYNVAIDAATMQPVYRNFILPATLFGSNLGKPVERVRPRFNSEYVWNIQELQRIGALAFNYHTKPMWFTEP